jgi:hypothetical protein
MNVLVGAWHAIRRNAETSKTRSTKEAAREYGRDLPRNLRKLQDRLRRGYKFEQAYGATPPKGAWKQGKRPIVVAPLPDRIVQRAILDVLQEAEELTGVQSVLATPTSIGGIPGRGVDCAIELIDKAHQGGCRFVAGSDIRGFFNQIPKSRVFEFLAVEVNEPAFMALVERALTVDLSNAGQMSAEDLHLFPTGADGVAQGCPLSALAGNIVLKDFDKRMNEASRGLICIRYIDDFVILGRQLSSVRKGMEAARAILRDLGMDTYDPVSSPTKAFEGPLGGGQVFLGHELIPDRYPPSIGAQKRLQSSINHLIGEGQKAIDKAVSGRRLRPNDKTFAATIVAISNTVQGWKGSFRSSKCPVTFGRLDAWVHRRIRDFESYFRTHTQNSSPAARDLALGFVPLMSPTDEAPAAKAPPRSTPRMAAPAG